MTPPGTCVLMVHGFASSAARSWRRQGWVAAFEEAGFDVLAPDLPGHGEAPGYEDPDAYGSIEGDLHNFVAGRKACAVGFSAGARMVLGIEADHPGTFLRIVVGGVGANALVSRADGALAKALESGNPGDAAGNPLAEVLVRAGERSADRQKALIAYLRRPNRRRFVSDDFPRITCPVLLVVGEVDEAAQPVSRLSELLPDSRALTIAGADHFETMRSPRFLSGALDFLRPALVGYSPVQA